MHKSGFVNIIGNPNVGKSTLMNALVGEKLSIITSKAQTTRHRIMGIVSGEDFQIVYSDTPGILKLELSGQVILDFLLDHFVPAVLYYDSAYCTNGQAPSKADKKLLAIFSGNYKQDYQNTRTGTESFDLYLRLLMVTDYISGMTDSYARTLYRELSGIE